MDTCGGRTDSAKGGEVHGLMFRLSVDQYDCIDTYKLDLTGRMLFLIRRCLV